MDRVKGIPRWYSSGLMAQSAKSSALKTDPGLGNYTVLDEQWFNLKAVSGSKLSLSGHRESELA